MSVMGQHLIRILQCDARYFTLTAKRLDELEKVVMENVDVTKEYDEMREKFVYRIRTKDGYMEFESKKRIDALSKLIIKTPSLHEPVRLKYNELVKKRFMSTSERKKDKIEARYQRRLELIRKLHGD